MSLVTLAGTVVVRERIAVPDGAVATVKLVDTTGEVLAAAAFEFTGAPLDYALTVDEELVAGDVLVWAMVRTDVGVWGTLDLAPHDPDEPLVLTRVGD